MASALTPEEELAAITAEFSDKREKIAISVNKYLSEKAAFEFEASAVPPSIDFFIDAYDLFEELLLSDRYTGIRNHRRYMNNTRVQLTAGFPGAEVDKAEYPLVFDHTRAQPSAAVSQRSPAASASSGGAAPKSGHFALAPSGGAAPKSGPAADGLVPGGSSAPQAGSAVRSSAGSATGETAARTALGTGETCARAAPQPGHGASAAFAATTAAVPGVSSPATASVVTQGATASPVAAVAETFDCAGGATAASGAAVELTQFVAAEQPTSPSQPTTHAEVVVHSACAMPTASEIVLPSAVVLPSLFFVTNDSVSSFASSPVSALLLQPTFGFSTDAMVDDYGYKDCTCSHSTTNLRTVNNDLTVSFSSILVQTQPDADPDAFMPAIPAAPDIFSTTVRPRFSVPVAAPAA